MIYLKKNVVVILPFNAKNNTVLMQLRDDKPDIDAPGVWGFFGGHINPTETSFNAAIRELDEEICYKASRIYHLNSGLIPNMNGIYAHAFTINLIESIEMFSLKEGRDFKFVSLKEVQDGKIYSFKLNKFFPIVKTHYIEKSFIETLNFWSQRNE